MPNVASIAHIIGYLNEQQFNDHCSHYLCSCISFSLDKDNRSVLVLSSNYFSISISVK